MVTDKKARSDNQGLGELWEVAQTLYGMVSVAAMAEQPWMVRRDGEGLQCVAFQHLWLKIHGVPGVKSSLACLLRTALALSRTQAPFNFIHGSGGG